MQLLLPPRILFGRGALAQAMPHLRALGDRLILVHSASASAALPLADDLRALGCTVHTYIAKGEPTLPGLEAALKTLRPHNAGAVIALGGGSALDLGKALAALLPGTHPPLYHLEVVGDGHSLDTAPLPFAAIPTTSGTGAEATKNAVISVPDAQRKVSLRDDRMIACLAVVDPALTEDVPPAIRLASGLDAITQVIEPYLSRNATPLTDALCRDAIPLGLRALRSLMHTPTEQAFGDMAHVSLSGGIALANAGLGAVHGLAGVLGGRTGAPHGALCGRLLVPVVRTNLARMRGPRGPEVLSWIAAAFPEAPDPLSALEAWIDAQGLPRLADLGVTPDTHGDVATESLAASSMRPNPVQLSVSDLLQILASS
ncbi:iron-containing alcohol dehydrogenase [Pseudooceanicola spongiae]|nr:iron-containing alcohol dehydrogenase [Pseudooceanicola spongiae]